MNMVLKYCFGWLLLVSVATANAQGYPDMVGLWQGAVRVVSSGNADNDRLDRGGIIISEIELLLTIDAQDGETFIGRSRVSTTPADNPGSRVWGSIRSAGDEALFITETGARGHLWFDGPNTFEYCLTSLSEGVLTSYCAKLAKQP